jgi:uncharacterized Rmd1/YagE family protein
MQQATTNFVKTLTVRALQLGERIDLKGLERADSFSKNPLAFRTPSGGAVVLVRQGAAVFIGLNPVEEEDIIRGLSGRITGPLDGEREIETAEIAIGTEEDTIAANGVIQLRNSESWRLLLVAEALAIAVSLSYDERRVGGAFDRVGQVAEGLKTGKLKIRGGTDTVSEIGNALSIQSRLAGRINMDDKPDVLWDHPELERLWAKLVDEYDLKVRANAIAQKLTVIRDSAETLGDLLATRTSHRLELYIIALIMFEIALSLHDRLWK